MPDSIISHVAVGARDPVGNKLEAMLIGQG